MKTYEAVRFIPLDLMRPAAAHRDYGRIVVFDAQTGLDGRNPDLLAQPRSGDVTRNGLHYFVTPEDILDEQGAFLGGSVAIIEPDSTNREWNNGGMADKIRVKEVRLYCTNNGPEHTNLRNNTLLPSPSISHRRPLDRGVLGEDPHSGFVVTHCIGTTENIDKVGGIPRQNLVVAHTFHHEGDQLVFTKFRPARRSLVRT